MFAGIAFLLWCLAHFIQEGLRFNKPTVTVIKIATHRPQKRKVFSISAETSSRQRRAVFGALPITQGAMQQHQEVIHLKSRFRKSL
jgi:hypothetical protein